MSKLIPLLAMVRNIVPATSGDVILLETGDSVLLELGDEVLVE